MNLISPNDRIYIAGHKGMVGKAITKALKIKDYNHLILAERDELDLREQVAVEDFFRKNKPEVVILAAAKVGGIYANKSSPADFLIENLRIQTNVIETAWKSGVKRLLFLGSSCIYPKFSKQPIKEEELLKGTLEETNQWYAIAKISGLKLCESLRIQYGFDAISLMPTNLYGPGDNYHHKNSHVLPAFIRKISEAKENGLSYVQCWGSGSSLREFLYVEDLGDAAIFTLETWQPKENEINHLNVGTGKDISIKELAYKVAQLIDYKGEILWDNSKPDGTPRKLLDITKIREIGWQSTTTLEEGILRTIESYNRERRDNTIRL